jgi:hypothetical protein
VSLRSRLDRAERLGQQLPEPERPTESAARRWYALLKHSAARVRVMVGASEYWKPEWHEGLADATKKLAAAIAVMDEFVALEAAGGHGPHMEYYTQGCLHRLHWDGYWADKQLAFMDDDHADHLRECLQIDQWRGLGQPAAEPQEVAL